MKTLFIIPARSGSKGIPGKNIKPLGGKPLIAYAIETALQCACADDVCVSTDSEEYARVAETFGVKVPFLRPQTLAADNASSRDMMLHALDFFRQQGRDYDRIVLLQPTSPFRTARHVKEALAEYDRIAATGKEIDMVVSVAEAATNPYYTAFETDAEGALHISKGDGLYVRRQDAPKVWELNGAIYVINTSSLRAKEMGRFSRRYPYVMDAESSVDLDTPLDWMMAEYIIAHKNK